MEALSDTNIADYESSTDEIFFGEIGEKERKVAERLLRRRTQVFHESFREHDSFLESSASSSSLVEDHQIEELSSFMEDSLNIVAGNLSEKPDSKKEMEQPPFVKDSLNLGQLAKSVDVPDGDTNNNEKPPSFMEDSLNPVESTEKLYLPFSDSLILGEENILKDDKNKVKNSVSSEENCSPAFTMKLELSFTGNIAKMLQEVENDDTDFDEKKVDVMKTNNSFPNSLHEDSGSPFQRKLKLSCTGDTMDTLNNSENGGTGFDENKMLKQQNTKQSFFSMSEETDTSCTTKLELSKSSYQDWSMSNFSQEKAADVDMTESIPISKLCFDTPKHGDVTHFKTEPHQECDILNEVLSSPEADFFNLDQSDKESIESSHQAQLKSSHLMDVLDLSFAGAAKNPLIDWEKTSTPARSLAGLNLHSSMCLEEAAKENQSPEDLELKDYREGAKHKINDESNKPQKRARDLYWSSPSPSRPVRSNIPVPIGSSGKLFNRELHKKGLKKWDVVSPVAQYIRERPLPPLFKTVKPLRELPLSKTPNAMKFHIKDITPIKQERSPTTFAKLPAAEYESSSQKMKKAINISPGNGCAPTIIRHKGPSKAIHGASHLLSDDSLRLVNQNSKSFGMKMSDVSINKSVIEVVQLQRTNTLLSSKIKK